MVVVLLSGGIILEVHERVFGLSLRSLARTLGQLAGSQCAVWGHGNALLAAEREHLALFLTHNQVVVVPLLYLISVCYTLRQSQAQATHSRLLPEHHGDK